MRLRARLILSALALNADPAAAQDAQSIETGLAPAWAAPSELLTVPETPAGLVFFRRNDAIVHLDASGQSTSISYRVRLLQSNALQLGNVAIAWNPAVGSPQVYTVTVYRDGAARDVLKQAKFDIIRRENQLEQARLDGLLTAVLRVPDLRVGDELEVAYSTRTNDRTLGPKSFGMLAIASDPPPGRFRMRLSWDEGQKPTVLPTDDLTGLLKREHSAMEVRMDMPRLATPPMNAPPRYNWQRILQYSDFASWQEVSTRFHGLFQQAARLVPDSPVRAEAAKIAAAHADPAGRVAAALKLVQQDVRYIFVGLNDGNLTPATADETWKLRYGDCKGKTALLMALLDQLGVPAEAVLVNTTGIDDGMDTRLPSPGLFDHVVVRVQVGGAQVWLDGTMPAVALASAEPIIPVRWVLPLAAAGRGLEHVPWRPDREPMEVTLTLIDARAGFDKPAGLKNTFIVRGARGLMENAQLTALTPDQLTESLRSRLLSGGSWTTIDSATYRFDVPSRSSILTIIGTGPVDWDVESTEKWLELPGGGFSPPERRVRTTETQQVPFYNKPDSDCHVTTVRVPESTTFGDWSNNSTYENRIFGRLYKRTFDTRAGAYRMTRHSRIETLEISSQSAAVDSHRLEEFDNSKAIISYEPSAKGGKTATSPEPAAQAQEYSSTWAEDASACSHQGEAGN